MEKISRSIPVTRPYKLPFESNKWGGAYFDRSATAISFITINNISLTDEFTMLSWFKKINSTPTAVHSFTGHVIDVGLGSKIVFVGSDILVRIVPGAGNTSANVGYMRSYDDTLNFVAVQRMATTNTIRALLNNGNFVNGIALAGIYNFNRIGINNDTQNFYGNMYDIVMIAEELTQPQIQDLMYGRILPTQFDCRLWHDYRLGHARDLSGNNNHGTLNGNVRFV